MSKFWQPPTKSEVAKSYVDNLAWAERILRATRRRLTDAVVFGLGGKQIAEEEARWRRALADRNHWKRLCRGPMSPTERSRNE